jgi:hypothetical protein
MHPIFILKNGCDNSRGRRRTVGAGEEASGMRVELSRGSFLALLILNNQYHKQSGILHVERS